MLYLSIFNLKVKSLPTLSILFAILWAMLDYRLLDYTTIPESQEHKNNRTSHDITSYAGFKSFIRFDNICVIVITWRTWKLVGTYLYLLTGFRWEKVLLKWLRKGHSVQTNNIRILIEYWVYWLLSKKWNPIIHALLHWKESEVI